MVQYNLDNHRSRSKKKVSKKAKPGQENVDVVSKEFLICDDCFHNTLTYEPSRDGACACGCH
ncbi:MAG TPA: hypothetical protein VH415_09790 [Nitrososphaeraceae archaeon]